MVITHRNVIVILTATINAHLVANTAIDHPRVVVIIITATIATEVAHHITVIIIVANPHHQSAPLHTIQLWQHQHLPHSCVIVSI